MSQGNIDYIDATYWQAGDGKRSLDMDGFSAGGVWPGPEATNSASRLVTLSAHGRSQCLPTTVSIRSTVVASSRSPIALAKLFLAVAPMLRARWVAGTFSQCRQTFQALVYLGKAFQIIPFIKNRA